MRWLLVVLACVAAQPSLPLLPDGVSISNVKQIQVTATGSVQFFQSQDSSSTIANRLAGTPIVKFDATTGILSVTVPDVASTSAASVLKPGLLAAFLAVLLCAVNSNKHSGWLLLLCVGLGVASANTIAPVADVTIRVPGCFHVEGTDSKTLVFDPECMNVNMTTFQADPNPVPTVGTVSGSNTEWKPITPSTSFLPVNDHGQHYLTPDEQWQVWRATFGQPEDPTMKQNFLAFTENCRVHNLDRDRNWTAACNQFAGLSFTDWSSQVLAKNADLIAAAEAAATGRRLLGLEEVPVVDMSESHRRKLLQSTTFSWVGTGRLTPVKDQGQCGSCYAHSTSSQMEAALAIATSTQAVPLSREQLKDCSQGNPGCNGGVPAYQFQYAYSTGLGTEQAFPYVPNNANCQTPTGVYKNTGSPGYVTVPNNELSFKSSLANGPIAVTVCADTWNNYAGGVFSSCSVPCSVNHAVLLVGYGVDAKFGNYWLIQNSWNTWWGEQGFIRIPNGNSGTAGQGVCGLTTYSGYQARTPVQLGASVQNCQGSWSTWSACSKTCGGGTQSKTWTTTAQPGVGGQACPNPTTVTQTCGTTLCPTPGGGGATGTCLHLSNTVLGPNGDGDYKKVADWNENWCGTQTLPQYTHVNGAGQTIYLFFYATNCYNNGKVAGQWGLGTSNHAGYQWADKQNIVNGVIPSVSAATGASWTMSITTGTTC